MERFLSDLGYDYIPPPTPRRAKNTSQSRSLNEKDDQPIGQASPSSVGDVCDGNGAERRDTHVHELLEVVRRSLQIERRRDSREALKVAYHSSSKVEEAGGYGDYNLGSDTLCTLLPARLHSNAVADRKARWMQEWEGKYLKSQAGSVNGRFEDVADEFGGMSLEDVLLPPPPSRGAPQAPPLNSNINEDYPPTPPRREAPIPPQGVIIAHRHNNLHDDFNGRSLSEVLPPRNVLTQGLNQTGIPTGDSHTATPGERNRFQVHALRMTDAQRAVAYGFGGSLSDLLPPSTNSSNEIRRERSLPRNVPFLTRPSSGRRWQPSATDYMHDSELSYDRLLSLDETVESGRKNHVDQRAVLKVMMSVKYHPRKHPGDPCVICLEEFSSGETLVKIRNCRCTKSLLYHNRCLRQWLKADSSCPQCRSSAT